MTVRSQASLTVVAAAGLLVLTIAAVVNPAAQGQTWHIVALILAWVTILSSALATRDRGNGDTLAGVRPTHADAPPAAPPVVHEHPPVLPTDRTPGGVGLVQFAQELHSTLERDRLHQLIARRLPGFVGRREVWVVARFGTRQHIIAPPTVNGAPFSLLTDDVRQWATFPMKVKGKAVGVLGVGLQAGGLSEAEKRLLTSVAGLVGQSLSTVDAFEVVREASLVDSLTGCVRRAEGLRRLEAELRRADRTRTSLAVLLLDLDHFKSVNDRFGHNTGDAVLTSLGDMLMKTLRASDVRCRWGGEEFLIVLPDSTYERARRASETLRERIAATPVRTSGHTVQVTASIGVTLTQPGEADIQKLLARADAALYRAKGEGRNRVEFFPGDVPNEAPTPPQTPVLPAERLVPVDTKGHWMNRRDPSRPDRRRIPSPGRRRTDPGVSVSAANYASRT